jgi:hypothetical protein
MIVRMSYSTELGSIAFYSLAILMTRLGITF